MTETYMQKRYRTNSIFRMSQIEYSKKYWKEHPKEINRKRRIKYSNRTVEQITARKLYLKKLRSKK